MKNAIQEFLAFTIIIVAGYALWAVTPASAGEYGREARDQCAANYPAQTGRGLSARMRCMADHPLSYGYSEYERVYVRYGLNMGQRVERGDMSYATAIAYMDRMESDFRADHIRRLANGFLNGVAEGVANYRVTNCTAMGNTMSCNSW